MGLSRPMCAFVLSTSSRLAPRFFPCARLDRGLQRSWTSQTTAARHNGRPFSLSSVSATTAPNQEEEEKLLPCLTLFTGTHCQLCDVAHSQLLALQKQVPFALQTYNIRDNSAPDMDKWRRMYQYDIPVLHLDGHEIGRHRFVVEKLREQILAASSSSSSKTSS